MTKNLKGLRLILWGNFRYRYLLLNKHISREEIIAEVQAVQGIGIEVASWNYAFTVGVIDGTYELTDNEGNIYVNRKAMIRRKLFMREGDIGWWLGIPQD